MEGGDGVNSNRKGWWVVLIQRLEGCGGVSSNDKHVGGCFSIWKTVDDVALKDKKIIAGRLLMMLYCWKRR